MGSLCSLLPHPPTPTPHTASCCLRWSLPEQSGHNRKARGDLWESTYWLVLAGFPSLVHQCLKHTYRQFPRSIIHSTPGPSWTTPLPLLLVGCTCPPLGITLASIFYLHPLTPSSCLCRQDPFQMTSGQQGRSCPAFEEKVSELPSKKSSSQYPPSLLSHVRALMWVSCLTCSGHLLWNFHVASHLTLESEIYQNLVHQSNLPIKHSVLFVFSSSCEGNSFYLELPLANFFAARGPLSEVAFVIPCPWEEAGFLYIYVFNSDVFD